MEKSTQTWSGTAKCYLIVQFLANVVRLIYTVGWVGDGVLCYPQTI